MKANLRELTVGLAAVALLALNPQNLQAYVHIDLDHAIWSPHANCGPVTLTPGGTDLLGVGVGWPQQPDTNITAALSSQFGGWSYTWATNQDQLNGTFTLDKDVAIDIHADKIWDTPTNWHWFYTNNGQFCLHGADAVFHYERAPTDPTNLDWIQLFTEWGNSGSRTNKVDPDPPDDNRPFYFTLTDIRSNFWRGFDFSGLDGTAFGDHPNDPHVEANPATGGVTFLSLLISWDAANPQNLTLQEYVSWGYQYICIPEPSFLALAVVSGSVVLVDRVLTKRRRRSRP